MEIGFGFLENGADKTSEHRKLTEDDMVFGIGRSATDEELREYLSLDKEDEEDIDISELRKKYSE